MLSPFDFAQAKLREASRFSNGQVLLAMNEILRRSTPQNDIVLEPVIANELSLRCLSTCSSGETTIIHFNNFPGKHTWKSSLTLFSEIRNSDKRGVQ